MRKDRRRDIKKKVKEEKAKLEHSKPESMKDE